MATIKFNNSTYTVENYNKNTSFDGENVTSTAFCSLRTTDIDSLHALAAEEITTIQIYNEEDLIYNVTNLHGRLNSMEEYLNGTQMNINLHFGFN